MLSNIVFAIESQRQEVSSNFNVTFATKYQIHVTIFSVNAECIMYYLTVLIREYIALLLSHVCVLLQHTFKIIS